MNRQFHSIACRDHFKHANCSYGSSCRFSHDAAVYRKSHGRASSASPPSSQAPRHLSFNSDVAASFRDKLLRRNTSGATPALRVSAGPGREDFTSLLPTSLPLIMGDNSKKRRVFALLIQQCDAEYSMICAEFEAAQMHIEVEMERFEATRLSIKLSTDLVRASTSMESAEVSILYSSQYLCTQCGEVIPNHRSTIAHHLHTAHHLPAAKTASTFLLATKREQMASLANEFVSEHLKYASTQWCLLALHRHALFAKQLLTVSLLSPKLLESYASILHGNEAKRKAFTAEVEDPARPADGLARQKKKSETGSLPEELLPWKFSLATAMTNVRTTLKQAAEKEGGMPKAVGKATVAKFQQDVIDANPELISRNAIYVAADLEPPKPPAPPAAATAKGPPATGQPSSASVAGSTPAAAAAAAPSLNAQAPSTAAPIVLEEFADEEGAAAQQASPLGSGPLAAVSAQVTENPDAMVGADSEGVPPLEDEYACSYCNYEGCRYCQPCECGDYCVCCCCPCDGAGCPRCLWQFGRSCNSCSNMGWNNCQNCTCNLCAGIQTDTCPMCGPCPSDNCNDFGVCAQCVCRHCEGYSFFECDQCERTGRQITTASKAPLSTFGKKVKGSAKKTGAKNEKKSVLSKTNAVPKSSLKAKHHDANMQKRLDAVSKAPKDSLANEAVSFIPPLRQRCGCGSLLPKLTEPSRRRCGRGSLLTCGDVEPHPGHWSAYVCLACLVPIPSRKRLFAPPGPRLMVSAPPRRRLGRGSLLTCGDVEPHPGHWPRCCCCQGKVTEENCCRGCNLPMHLACAGSHNRCFKCVAALSQQSEEATPPSSEDSLVSEDSSSPASDVTTSPSSSGEDSSSSEDEHVVTVSQPVAICTCNKAAGVQGRHKIGCPRSKSKAVSFTPHATQDTAGGDSGPLLDTPLPSIIHSWLPTFDDVAETAVPLIDSIPKASRPRVGQLYEKVCKALSGGGDSA